jgi:type III pantothenate kinase
VPVEAPSHALGRDTVEAIQSGVVLGHILAVSGLIRRAAAEVTVAGAPRPRVILTGGFATASWAEAIEGVEVRDPELLLRGLARHAETWVVARGTRA